MIGKPGTCTLSSDCSRNRGGVGLPGLRYCVIKPFSSCTSFMISYNLFMSRELSGTSHAASLTLFWVSFTGKGSLNIINTFISPHLCVFSVHSRTPQSQREYSVHDVEACLGPNERGSLLCLAEQVVHYFPVQRD